MTKWKRVPALLWLGLIALGHPPALVLNSAGEVKASLAHGGLP